LTIRFIGALTVALLAFGAVPALSDDNAFQSRESAAFSRAHGAVVFIISADEQGNTSGCTGAVVESNQSTSTILTAAHCVIQMSRFSVVLHEDVGHPYRASVVRAGSINGTDLAFLRVGVGNQPVLKTGGSVEVGANIVIIGYPRAALSNLKKRGILTPRQDATTISSVVPRNGPYPQTIDYAQVTDHGDSGAPVIELECGCIVGVVHGQYDPQEGKSDYAMGPDEVQRFASIAPEIALGHVGRFKPIAAPTAAGVALVGPTTGTTTALAARTLGTIGGSAGQWSGWGNAIALSAIGNFSIHVRCLELGDSYVWQVGAANERNTRVAFRHRLVDAQGNAPDAIMPHNIDNDGSYLFRPQVLGVPCTSRVFNQTRDVSFVGAEHPPKPTTLLSTDGGPAISFQKFTSWSPAKALPGVKKSFRCIDLTEGWYAYQVAFWNPTTTPYTFDFDLQPKSSTADFRHRYRLPVSPNARTFYYSDPIPLKGTKCVVDDAQMWTRNVVHE